MAKQWFIESCWGSFYVDLIQAFPMSLKLLVGHHGRKATVKFKSSADYISAKEGEAKDVTLKVHGDLNYTNHNAKIYFKEIDN